MTHFTIHIALDLHNTHIPTAGIGIDTAALDPAIVANFPTHFILQGNNKWGLENLCCLDLVPEKGSFLSIYFGRGEVRDENADLIYIS